ncbi:MAG: Na(+)-translocating NADH-quinone reductase subunit A [Bacteroidales bacterium]|jgi:Na+-transporting NADH:ubiquinone oxidoreductase subunit A|nr:Na(+)-translocating NADH-quinone reductase subunit A [Bacteroidales bacterium]
MSKTIRIRKGLNIKLKGKAEKILVKAEPSDKYAIKPADFPGLIPKMLVKEGDTVKAGTPLFMDKNRPEVLFASPVSGTLEAVVRGEKRRILEVVVKADGKDSSEDFSKAKPVDSTKEAITGYLLAGGVWPFIRQRPYAIIANPQDTPKSIFISCFDTAPLGPDYDYIFQNVDPDFQTGVDTLAKLTSGRVHLCVHTDYPPAANFAKAKNVEIHQFSGPHPSSNVGVQIHHIDPVNKGEAVWYVNPQDVSTIGRLMNRAEYDVSKTIVLCGSEINTPRYYKVKGGCRMTAFADNVKAGNVRYISGNVLTGAHVAADGYLGFYDSQVTVIPEGDHYELLGWALPGFGKYSAGRTFFSWLTPHKEYDLDTNMHGGHRALVMTGQYESVFPMDIYPEHLVKAILAGEIEKMEQLGIYEVAEEDFALCEFVCTSKTDVQSTIREGIDMMIKEMS